MRRRITRALLTAAAAGATITTLGFAAAGPASATPSGTPNISSGGWAAGNVLAPTLAITSNTWRFRYASATTTLRNVSPAVPDLNNNAAQQAFSVQLSNLKATYAAQLIASKATGAWSVQFVRYFQDTTVPPDNLTSPDCNSRPPIGSPWTVGTAVRLDVFYDQNGGTITFTAYSGSSVVCQVTKPAWVDGTLGGGPFTEAYTGGVFTKLAGPPITPPAIGPPPITQGNPYGNGLTTTPPWIRPSVDRSLFPVTATKFTSYNGTTGSVQGPWPYQELAFGTSMQNDLADPGILWNGGQNFGVWLRS